MMDSFPRYLLPRGAANTALHRTADAAGELVGVHEQLYYSQGRIPVENGGIPA